MARGRRILLLEDGEQIVGVAAHRDMNDPGGQGFVVSWLEVAALAVERHGARLADGSKLSALLLNALLTDATAQPGRAPIVAAYVAEENRGGRRSCADAGLVEDPVREMLISQATDGPTPYVFASRRFR